jgi:transketolase
MIKNKDLKRRIIDITYHKKLSHLSSCLNAVDTIVDIYNEKLPTDKFVLSCGHAGLALYVVLEALSEGMVSAEFLINKCGIHPERLQAENYIDCSTGSLGQGLPIAVGMALADRNRSVYCIISDGECAEGSIYEALNTIIEERLTNIKVYCIINGQSAYKKLDTLSLENKLKALYPQINIVNAALYDYPVIGHMGLLQHYRVLDEAEYKSLMEYLK